MSCRKVTGCELSVNDGGVGGEWGVGRRVAGGAPTAIKRQIRTNKRPIHEGGRVQLEQMGVGVGRTGRKSGSDGVGMVISSRRHSGPARPRRHQSGSGMSARSFERFVSRLQNNTAADKQ